MMSTTDQLHILRNAVGEVNEEVVAWLDLPFVHIDERGDVQHWSPLRLQCGHDGRGFAELNAIGQLYGLLLIEHVVRFEDAGRRLIDVAKALPAHEKWSGIELAFVATLADYIRQRKVALTAGIDATISIHASSEEVED